jgi:YVTN family beta-propeller protein
MPTYLHRMGNLRGGVPVWLVFLSISLLVLPVFLSGVYADRVVTTIPTGISESGIATNPVTNRIYVADHSTSSVTVIDGSTRKFVARVHVDGSPYSLATNPATNRVYVVHFTPFCGNSNGIVSVIDGLRNVVVAKVTVGTCPFDVAVNPSTHRVYVSDPLARMVFVIDSSTNRIVGNVTVGEVYNLAVNPVTNRIYAQYSCNVAVIDGSSNKVLTSINVSCPLPSNDVTVNPDTNRFYVVARYSVEVFDGATNQRIASIYPGCNAPQTTDIDRGTKKLYVDCINNKLLAIIDASTNLLLQTISLSDSPQDVGADPRTNLIYVAGTTSIIIVDGRQS